MFGVIRDTWHKIAAAHRSADETGAGTVLEFFVPRLKRAFFIRMSVVALLAAVVFGFVLIPCVINGESMVPTFPAHGFTFCWRGKYLFGKPRRGDVVIIRYADQGLFPETDRRAAGETVEFRNGDLYINGQRQTEPYVHYICDWNLPPRTVEPGHYYVVGDNRSQPIEQHKIRPGAGRKNRGSPAFLGLTRIF